MSSEKLLTTVLLAIMSANVYPVERVKHAVMPKIYLCNFPAKENREGCSEIVINHNSTTVVSTDKMMTFFP